MGLLNFSVSILSIYRTNDTVVCVKYYLFLILTVFTGFGFTTAAAEETLSYPGETLQLGKHRNPPLLVMVGGALDRTAHKAMYKVANAVPRIKTYAPVTVLYFTWDSDVALAVTTHREFYPTSKVVLVGHSWGGDTVITSGSAHEEIIDLVVTLDGVSKTLQKEPRERGSVKRWINAYARLSLWSLLGKWGEVPGASKNVNVPAAAHTDVKDMYKAVDTLEILPVLLNRKPKARAENIPSPAQSTLFHNRDLMLQ